MVDVDKIIAYEQGDLSESETVKMFQEMIDDGSAWELQGHYGRTAKALIEAGHCHEKIKEPEQVEYDLDNRDDKSAYDEMLDETSGPVKIAGLTFDSHNILEECDPTAYRCGFNDYTDGLPERWKCPVCDKIHEDNDSAKWCCQTEPEEPEGE